MAKENLHPDHPLLTLQGRCVEEYALEVEAWPGRFVGQAGFVLYLRDAEGNRSDRSVVEGLYGRTKTPGSREESHPSRLPIPGIRRGTELGRP